MEIYYVVLGTSRVIKKIHKSLTFTKKQLTEISNVLLLLALILIVTVPHLLLSMHSNHKKRAYTDQHTIHSISGRKYRHLREIDQGILTQYFRIPLKTVASISNDSNVKIYEKNAGSFSFLLNPAPSKNPNILNPFQFKEIRFAVNYLINH